MSDDAKIIIFDIDHTVSDAAWRDNMMGTAMLRGNWDEYNRLSINDPPIMDTVKLIRDLSACGWRAIGLTAMDEKWRKLRINWMLRHYVPFDELLMRPDGDRRTSPELKVAMVKERFSGDYTSIAMIMDDREDVVLAFRELGITAFQVHAKMGRSTGDERLRGIERQQLRAEHRRQPLDAGASQEPAD